jgi:mxaA protein
MRTRPSLYAALILCSPWLQSLAGAAAQNATPEIGSVRLDIERRVGYLLGDLIPYDAVVTVDRSWRLRDSSLPTPGHSEYWLELRRVSLDQEQGPRARTYRIHMLYQSFYAPLEARTRDLPGFSLTFDHDNDTTTLAVPALTITMSPLREVMTGTGDPEENVKPNPDHAPGLEPLRAAALGIVVSTIVVLAGLIGFAWQRGLGPFNRIVRRPFGSLARSLSRGRGHDPAQYGGALRSMHRAFDATAGWRVFSEDQDRFLQQWPRYRAADTEIGNFFAASRSFFFGSDASRANSELPQERLERLARKLAILERGQ